MTNDEAINVLETFLTDEWWMSKTAGGVALRVAIEALKQTTPNLGHWKEKHYDQYVCSKCGGPMEKVLSVTGRNLIDQWSNYCPNCGARMMEEQNDE